MHTEALGVVCISHAGAFPMYVKDENIHSVITFPSFFSFDTGILDFF